MVNKKKISAELLPKMKGDKLKPVKARASILTSLRLVVDKGSVIQTKGNEVMHQ